MKIDTTTTTQKTTWVHFDPDELHALIAQAAWKAAGIRTVPQDASATIHFTDDAPRSAPSRPTMRATVELITTRTQTTPKAPSGDRT
jgi:hypothetical protein